MSASILANEIKQVVIDMKSEKVTTRSKGLDNFHHLIDNRGHEVYRLLISDQEDCITWPNLYFDLHDALKQQCVRLDSCRSGSSLTTLKNKNDSFKSALTKCINLANEKSLSIPFRQICDTVFECFGNPVIRKYFDVCYLKIISKHVLNTKFNLDGLEISDWSSKFMKKNIFDFNSI